MQDADATSFAGSLGGAGWLSAARLVGDFTGGILFIAVSRAYGLDGAGVYSYAFAVGGVVQVLGHLGIEGYATRDYARLALAERRALLARVLGTQLWAAAFLVPCVALFLRWTGARPDTAAVVALFSAYHLGYAFVFTLLIPAFTRRRMFGAAVGEMLTRGGAPLVATALVLSGAVALPVAMLPIAVGAVLMVAVAAVSAWRNNGELRLDASSRSVARVAREAWPFAASIVATGLHARLGTIVLSLARGEAAAGLWATGLKLLEFAVVPAWMIGVATYPAVSRAFETDGAGFARLASRLTRTALFLGGLLGWGLVFVVPEWLGPVLGSEFVRAAPVVRCFGALGILAAADMVAMRLLFAMNRQTARLRAQAAALAVLIALFAALVPAWGVAGALAAAFASQLLLLALSTAALGRDLRRKVLAPVALRFTVALASGLLAAALAYVAGAGAAMAGAAALLAYLAAACAAGLVPRRPLTALRSPAGPPGPS